MKRQMLFSFVVSLFLFTAGPTHAVWLGDNVRVPYISLFRDSGPNFHYEQIVPGGALEVTASDWLFSLVSGVGGLYHFNANWRSKIIPYAGGATVFSPWVPFTTPDVFTASGQLASGYSAEGLMGGWFTSGGGATSGGIAYGVQSIGFRVRNNATHTLVGRFTIQGMNWVTKAVLWSKTYVDGAISIQPDRCEVKDIDGDGNDELVIARSQRLTLTTVRWYVDVFNLATGGAKRATLTWVDFQP